MYAPRRTASQSPPTTIGWESGSPVRGFAGHSATATTPSSLRISRRTNYGAGAHISVPGIPAQFVPPTRAPALTPTMPTPPRVPAAPPGASAGWPGSFIPTTAPPPPWPVPSSTGPPKQHNDLQGAYRPLYRDVQGNTNPPFRMRNVMLVGPSSAPGLRQSAFPPPTNPSTNSGAFAPAYDGAASQRAYAAGSASALPSQYPVEMSTSLGLQDNIHRVPASPQVGLFNQENNALTLGQAAISGFTAPLPEYAQSNSAHLCICKGDHWSVTCDLAWEHCNVAMNSPTPTIRLPCTCPPGLPPGQIPKGCPKVADHFLNCLRGLNYMRANQIRMAVARNHAAPSATYQSYGEAGSQATSIDNIKLPSREMGNLQAAQEGQGSHFSESTSAAPLLHANQSAFTSLPTFEISASTRDTGQPSNIDQKPDPIATHQATLGGDLPSTPVEFTTVTLSDIVGTSAEKPVPQGGGASCSLSKRRKASLTAIVPSTKRARRAPQSSGSERTGTQVDAMDEARGFVDPTLDPDVQTAMRDLVAAIRAARFFTDNKLEPTIGTHEAVALMAVAPPELWQGYGAKAKSIYSLFVRVDGKECRCLWCGDVQQGKLQRAVGHFRAKHLAHEPYICGEVHVGGEAHVGDKVCNVKFATLEALGEHRRRKEKLKAKGPLPCSGCERSYTSISNLNRHREKCDGAPVDPKATRRVDALESM